MRSIISAMSTALAVSLMALSPTNAADWQAPEPLRVSERIFSDPHDIALSPDGLYLFIADNGNDAVEILVPGGLNSIGQLGPGTFSAPHDVAFDNNGHVYIADTANGRIAIWKFDGVSKYAGVQAEFIGEWSDGIVWPEGIDIAPSGRAYVADVRADALLVLEGGTVVHRITEAGDIEFDRPHDVEVGPSGNIYLTDPGNDRIVIFKEDLSVHRILDGEAYDFDEPKYLGLDSNGMLFVADEDNDRIRMLKGTSFEVTGDIADEVMGSTHGGLNGPEGVVVEGRYIWVSDTSNDRIILLRRKPK